MPQDFKGKEPIGWFTANGVHLPIYEGETTDDAINRLRETIDDKLPKKSFKTFNAVEGVEKEVQKYIDNDDNSNAWLWRSELSDEQVKAIRRYTSSGDVYDINKALYSDDRDSLTTEQKDVIKNLDEAMNNFTLYKGISVTRHSDAKMLGFKEGERPDKQQIIDKLQETFGHLEYPAYLSSGVDNEGAPVNAFGVMVHIQVPPSKGAGAYISNSELTSYPEENEFLFARHTVLKYDLNSLKSKNGIWEINARYIGKVEEE